MGADKGSQQSPAEPAQRDHADDHQYGTWVSPRLSAAEGGALPCIRDAAYATADVALYAGASVGERRYPLRPALRLSVHRGGGEQARAAGFTLPRSIQAGGKRGAAGNIPC